MYFENIIGQEFAKKYITNAIDKNMLNNAYIFEGIKGIGKKTFAREMARILIGMSPENSLDFNVISGDENTGRIKIEKIRKMKAGVYEKPESDYKIYVIEGAHLMTEEAQNAILKTIEEPPSYAIFILIAENREMLLGTIKSRCDIVRFLPLPVRDVKNYLKENFDIDEKKSSVCASFSKGSITKAKELLEDEHFKEMREDIQDFIETISSKNKIKIEFLADNSEKYEKDIMDFLDVMMNCFRDIIISKEGLKSSMITNTDRKTFIENMSYKFTCSQLSAIIDIIEETRVKLIGFCNFRMSIQVMFLNIYEVIK